MKIRFLPAEQARVLSTKQEHHMRQLDRSTLPEAQSNERLLQILDAITQTRRERLARQRLAQQESLPS